MIEHKTLSLADQVFEHLETDILSGKYPRGEVLTEAHLSAELGVSRTPVREALRRLAQEHLIEETPKGNIVIGISEKDLEDIFVIREHIEGLAAAAAAKNRTDEQLKELLKTIELQEFYVSKQDCDEIKLMDTEFHRLVYSASGGITFFDTLEPLHKKIQKYRRAAVSDHSRATHSVEEHRKIYEAIAAKDSATAKAVTVEHIKNAHIHIVKKGN
ncbi:MAG: GntR family transcriptional regulator [Oscillospiraceae bacterium]|nr:GntR family transcriptional regulator [Oscillospiraceae bacterium]